MTAALFYFPPLLSLIALPFLVMLVIVFTRFADLVKGNKPASYYEDFDGAGASIGVMRPTRQLVNLFEFPVLFYVAVVLLIAIDIQDNLLLKLCWVYVVFRWLHAASHLFLNRLWLRTPIFAVGNVVLLGVWVRISFIVFT